MIAGESTLQPSADRVRQQLDEVLKRRTEIAAELQAMARQSAGVRRRKLRILSRAFARPITANEVLQWSDALAVCLPLLKQSGSAAVGRVESESLAHAVRTGCERLSDSSSTRSRALVLLLYPLLLLAMSLSLLVVCSLFLVPEFEQMFDEFDLMLPPTTAFVVELSHYVQRFWIPVLVIVATVVVFFVMTAVIRAFRVSPAGEPAWLGGLTVGIRSAWARWAWHVSLLLESGIPQADAIAIAGQSNIKPSLRRWSEVWSGQLRSGSRPFERLTHSGDRAIHTLGYALGLTDLSDQAGLLRAVAENYWDRDRNRSLWWIAWLGPLTITLVGAFVGILVAALFMPLVQLISGLT